MLYMNSLCGIKISLSRTPTNYFRINDLILFPSARLSACRPQQSLCERRSQQLQQGALSPGEILWMGTPLLPHHSVTSTPSHPPLHLHRVQQTGSDWVLQQTDGQKDRSHRSESQIEPGGRPAASLMFQKSRTAWTDQSTVENPNQSGRNTCEKHTLTQTASFYCLLLLFFRRRFRKAEKHQRSTCWTHSGVNPLMTHTHWCAHFLFLLLQFCFRCFRTWLKSDMSTWFFLRLTPRKAMLPSNEEHLVKHQMDLHISRQRHKHKEQRVITTAEEKHNKHTQQKTAVMMMTHNGGNEPTNHKYFLIV